MEDANGHGVFRIGSRLVGVPLDHVSEVCVLPDLTPLMFANPALLGAFDLRGSLVPVLDVEHLSGLPPRTVPAKVAAILRYKDRMTGLALDDIHTLSRHAPTDISARPMVADCSDTSADDSMFSRYFLIDGDVISCLNTSAMFARDDILTIADTRTAARRTADPNRQKLLIFSAGGARFSVDANHIGATVPRQRIDTSEIGGDSGPCLGFIRHQSWKVPVVHTNKVLGLGRPDPLGEAEIAVLRFPDDKLLGFAVQDMERLVSITDTDLRNSSPLVAKAGILKKVFTGKHGEQTHVIDVPALVARQDLVELSGLSRRTAKTESAVKRDVQDDREIIRERERYLVFEAGRTLAVRATQVVRILKSPGNLVPANDAHRSVKGLFTFGDLSIPLVSLDSDAETGPPPYVLLVGPPEQQVGFAATRVCSLQTSDWRSADIDPTTGTDALVQLTEGGRSSVLPIANLMSLAQTVTGHADAAVP